MVKLTINNKTLDVENGITVLQACEIAGIEIPRFCYHERLSIAGIVECVWLRWKTLQNLLPRVLCQ